VVAVHARLVEEIQFSIDFLKLSFLKDTADDGGADELTVANVGGVFAVLISGGFVGVVVCMFEMLLDVRSRAKELEVKFEFFLALARML
jgi:hypothetical protein